MTLGKMLDKRPEITYVLNENPCGECAQFRSMIGLFQIGSCRKKLMAVTRTMLATCPISESCFEEKTENA